MDLLNKAVREHKGQATTTSRMVAQVFKKEHKHVLDTIRETKITLDETDNLAAEFSAMNFKESFYKSRGKVYPEYILSKEGFTLVTMGYTGKKAMAFKVRYINQFNQMEQFIQSLQTAKLEFPAFTNAIMGAHEEPKHYHFSNEINMINKIVLGMTASQFKKENAIDKKVNSIRPYLQPFQIKAIEELQRVDIGLIVAVPEYQDRKKILENYFSTRVLKKIA